MASPIAYGLAGGLQGAGQGMVLNGKRKMERALQRLEQEGKEALIEKRHNLAMERDKAQAERTAETEDMLEVWDPKTQTNKYVPKSQATGMQPARDLDGKSGSTSGSGPGGWSSEENRKYEAYKARFTSQNDLGDSVVDYESMHRAMQANGDDHLIIKDPPDKKGKAGTQKEKASESDDGGWFSGWFGGSEEKSQSSGTAKSSANQSGQKTFTRADAEASAQKHGMSVQEVIRKLENNGWRLVD